MIILCSLTWTEKDLFQTFTTTYPGSILWKQLCFRSIRFQLVWTNVMEQLSITIIIAPRLFWSWKFKGCLLPGQSFLMQSCECGLLLGSDQLTSLEHSLWWEPFDSRLLGLEIFHVSRLHILSSQGNTTDMELASLNSDMALACEIKHDDKLTDEDGVYIQVKWELDTVFVVV